MCNNEVVSSSRLRKKWDMIKFAKKRKVVRCPDNLLTLDKQDKKYER
jgi:hypothetical protein